MQTLDLGVLVDDVLEQAECEDVVEALDVETFASELPLEDHITECRLAGALNIRLLNHGVHATLSTAIFEVLTPFFEFLLHFLVDVLFLATRPAKLALAVLERGLQFLLFLLDVLLFVAADFATLFLDGNENTGVTLNDDIKFVTKITSTEDFLSLGIKLESKAFRDKPDFCDTESL